MRFSNSVNTGVDQGDRPAPAVGRLSTLILTLTLLWCAGCGESKSTTRQDPPSAGRATAPVARSEVPVDDGDLLRNVPVGAAATNPALLAGDQAWKEFVQSMVPPPAPAEWETNRPTKEAIAEFNRKNGLQALKVSEKAREFYTKYPNHEKASEARAREEYLLGAAVQAGLTNAAGRLRVLEEAKLKDPNLSEEERIELRVGQLQREVMSQAPQDMEARLTAFEKGARALMKEFPARPELGGLLQSVSQGWLDQGSIEKARALATELVKGKYPEELQADSASLLKKIDRLGKPLAVQFKAVDGRSVDLQTMKGKVVLIDFWATWCGPCMAELPNVKATYAKLKPKGFEIIGISLDRDKASLTNVLAAEGMSWPQHLEEEGEPNRFAKEFEVSGIPTMWLVDKKGNLRTLNAREGLEAQAEKLLAE